MGARSWAVHARGMCLAALCVLGSGVYQDAVGVSDRVVLHLGPPAHAAFPSLHPQLAILTTDASTLAAVNTETGSTAWRWPPAAEEALIASTPAANASLVVSLIQAATLLRLRAVDTATGVHAWDVPLTDASLCPGSFLNLATPVLVPAPHNDHLLVVTSQTVYHVATTSGTVLHAWPAPQAEGASWRGAIWARSTASPTIAPVALSAVRAGHKRWHTLRFTRLTSLDNGPSDTVQLYLPAAGDAQEQQFSRLLLVSTHAHSLSVIALRAGAAGTPPADAQQLFIQSVALTCTVRARILCRPGDATALEMMGGNVEHVDVVHTPAAAEAVTMDVVPPVLLQARTTDGRSLVIAAGSQLAAARIAPSAVGVSVTGDVPSASSARHAVQPLFTELGSTEPRLSLVHRGDAGISLAVAATPVSATALLVLAWQSAPTTDVRVWTVSVGDAPVPEARVLALAAQVVPASTLPAEHGAVARAFAATHAPADAAAAASLRLVLVQEDGTTSFTRSGRVVTTTEEGDACVVQTLTLDTQLTEDVSVATSSLSEVSELAWGARMAAQLRSLAAWVSTGARLPGMQPSERGNGATLPGAMLPLAPNALLQKVYVTRTSFVSVGVLAPTGTCYNFAQGAAARAPLRATLTARVFESGAKLWQRAVAPAASTAPLASVQMLTSRPRSLHHHAAEVLLATSVGAGATPGCGCASAGVQKDAGMSTRFEWIDVKSGAVVMQATAEHTAPITDVVRTPVIDDVASREAFAFVFAGAQQALIAPITPAVSAQLDAVAPAFVFSTFTRALKSQAVTGLAGYKLARASSVSEASATQVRAVIHVWSVNYGIDASDSASAPASRILAFAPPVVHGAVSAAHAAFAEDGGSAAVSPAHILGDDSLLLKYLYPHAAVVVYGTPGVVPGPLERAFARAGAPFRNATSAALPVCTVALLDLANGRVLYSRVHFGTSGPVAVARQDHWVVYTLWNANSSRPELTSAAMFEGVIGARDLTLWSNTATAFTVGATNYSDYTASNMIVVHRTFTLPTAVRDVIATRTREHMTTPAYLFATATGGVLMLEKQWLDPRRPQREPTDGEKAEGLIQYSPILPLRHTSLLTHQHTLPQLRTLHSSPSAYESTTYVAAIGLDHFFAYTAPARTFDQLDRNFSALFFWTVVIATSVGTLVLRNFVRGKEMRVAWA